MKNKAGKPFDAIAEEVISAASVLKKHLNDHLGDERLQEAWDEIETYLAISVRVMKATNPSKIRDAARTVAIAHLMPPSSKK